MLLDTLDATSGIAGVCRLIFFDGPEQRADDFRMLAPDAEVYRQYGTDLGERLLHAFETAFAMGFRSVGVIGTDAPHMPFERVTNAFLLLNEENADVVIGPTEDGGYYLLAMKRIHRELFLDMPWSTAKVLENTITRAGESELLTSLLPPDFDLDTMEDLSRLAENFWQSLAGRTRSMLDRLRPG
jgi:rSAM/selenodomain-associated transferase 1